MAPINENEFDDFYSGDYGMYDDDPEDDDLIADRDDDP